MSRKLLLLLQSEKQSNFSYKISLKSIALYGGAFLLREKSLLMSEPKTIYCPGCGRKVGIWDGRSTINHSCSCKNCNKLVVYYVETGEVKLKEIPKRHCSSGMTFY